MRVVYPFITDVSAMLAEKGGNNLMDLAETKVNIWDSGSSRVIRAPLGLD